jgi:hypothetical protein
MNSHYDMHQEDRVFFAHIERGLLAILKRPSNTPRQSEALTGLLAGLWNLPRVTPHLSCALEYCPTEVAMRFEISGEAVSFSYGSSFHATFWSGGGGQHVGDRRGECREREIDYHSWKVLLEMFENDLCDLETEFTVEVLELPSLGSEGLWHTLPAWKAAGVYGLTDIEA